MRTSAPTTTEGIEKYLGAGMIRGIGPVYAKKMVKAFGNKVFDVIEAEPSPARSGRHRPDARQTHHRRLGRVTPDRAARDNRSGAASICPEPLRPTRQMRSPAATASEPHRRAVERRRGLR
jgi:hypothetical protein